MFHTCLRNAQSGMPNSQLDVAKFYFYEQKDFLEAYAWADVASCNNSKTHEPDIIKKDAFDKLKPEQIKTAWDMARSYKKHFLPKN